LAEELQLELLNGKAPGTQCPQQGESYKKAPVKSTPETLKKEQTKKPQLTKKAG